MAMTLLLLGVLYFGAHAVAHAFTRTRVPDVLLLMVVGIVAGPITHLVPPTAFGTIGPVLATITLAAILFESGTALDLMSVARSARSTLAIALATAAVTIAIVAIAGASLGGLTWGTAFLLGAIVSGTSSAVVIPMVSALRMKEQTGTILILESALTDVLCIVLTFALLDAQTQDTVQVGPVIGRTLASLTFAAVIGVAGGTAWLRIWNWVRQFPATMFATLAWALVLYGFAEVLGFSGAIAVLSLGLSLRNHESLKLNWFFRGSTFSGIDLTEQRFYAEVVFLLKTFFFVYLGISMRFDSIEGFVVAAVALAGVYAARVVIVRGLVSKDAPRNDAAVAAVMVPKGLAAAVLAGLPIQAGVAGGETVQAVTYAIVLISITLTALAAGFLGTNAATGVKRALFGKFPTDSAGPA